MPCFAHPVNQTLDLLYYTHVHSSSSNYACGKLVGLSNIPQMDYYLTPTYVCKQQTTP